MIGTNILLLNKATIMKAIEYYLNNVKLKDPVKVNGITENTNDHVFEVTFHSPDKDEKEG